ncbi:MAG: Uncharacterized protein FD133_1327 [Erysipelotrichaceae bacterium]|nr:MAG: hypothetical protein FD179_1951 [Erysipelotrichaceae bacterium]TXT17565.1 MAG: Uncharacterized protein FD133_1327 [Erysipelotrichaceae bacterium]
MKRMIIIVIALSFFTACSVDELKETAKKSFTEVVSASSVITMVEDGVAHIKITADAHIDFALDTNSQKDVYMAFKIQPFLDAGLDVSLLPVDVVVNGDMLVFSFNIKDTKVGTNAVSQLSNVLDANRGLLTYHKELDHYGLKLGVHKFEWAKTMATNNKDAVFILDGDTLVSWGIDLDLVSGWSSAEIDGDSLLLLPISLD